MPWRSDKRLRDNERRLIEILTRIEEKHPNVVIIVEGKRDVQILRDLGLKTSIVRTQTRRTRPELIDDIVEIAEGCEVLILTDYDQEGIEIAKFLEQELAIRKITTLSGLRIRIRRAMGNWRCIEEFIALFKRKDSPDRI